MTDPVADAGSPRRQVEEWLANRRLAASTKFAYRRELIDWLSWCEEQCIPPLSAQFVDVNAYARDLESIPRPKTGRPLNPASTARALAAVASWYDHLRKRGIVRLNPVEAADRPYVDPDASTTIGLSGEQVGQFMRAARCRTGPTARRDAALIGVLAQLGLRVGEAIGLDLESLRTNRGHRTVIVNGKGGKRRELPVTPVLGRDLDEWLVQRGDAPGPLFATGSGRRLDEPSVLRLVQRVARLAGLPEANRLTPHGLRHTVATAALQVASLHTVQDMLGHADPRTTRRYDRRRGSLDDSPAYLVASLFAEVL